MKKLLAVLLIALMLTGLALSVSADPTNVGGSFTASSSGVRGPTIYPGKGIPQGIPFQIVEANLLLSPTNVGGS